MSKTLAVSVVLIVLGAASADAQGRRGPRGVPPGHLPPPGSCRVWYEGVPPGHQPPSTDCHRAERLAAHDPDAAVVYGARGYRSHRKQKHDRGWDADWIRLAFEYGYEDGYAGARIDVGRRAYDPWRHDGYRHGGRGYNKKHGRRALYRDRYREGFEAGYEAGYRDATRRRSGVTIAGEVYFPF